MTKEKTAIVELTRGQGLVAEAMQSFRNRDTTIHVSKTEMMSEEALLASRLVERWGLVAAEIDGEDSAGRAKLRRLKPDELVRDACDTAKLLLQECRSRNWMLAMPSIAEAEAKLYGE